MVAIVPGTVAKIGLGVRHACVARRMRAVHDPLVWSIAPDRTMVVRSAPCAGLS
jgi:hypothetical protein